MIKPKFLWSERHYLLRRQREAFIRWVAWRLPRELVMWCYVRVGANATTGKYENTVVPELSMMDALERWDQKQKGVRL